MLTHKQWKLVAKKISGDATNKELHELEVSMRDNPDIEYYLQILTAFWETRTHLLNTIDERMEKTFNKIWNRLQGNVHVNKNQC